MNETTTPSPKTGLALLREPFPDNHISKLPKPFKRDSEKGLCQVCGTYHGLPAMHLDYVGHAAVTHRLLDVDPGWTWEPAAFDDQGLPAHDKSGGMWIRLTVLGVTRLGYGNAEQKPTQEAGSREKEVIGDALRNAAMRFGVALDLWHKGDLHGNGDDDDDTATTRKARENAEGNANGAAPTDQRRPASPPPARKSASSPPAASPSAGSSNSAASPAVTEGQVKNLLVKIKSLSMDDTMVEAMLTRLGVRAIDAKMTLADWRRVKAELETAARAV